MKSARERRHLTSIFCDRISSNNEMTRRAPPSSPSDASCCPPPAAMPRLPRKESDQNALLAKLAKALGHPVRVSILRTLLQRDTCVAGELAEGLPLAQSTVSQHLKQLKQAGLIRGEVSGPCICYCAEPSAVALLKALISAL